MSYQDLLESIQTAQRDAGEQAVIAHLRSQGLIDSEPEQPAALAESEQSATESVAVFTHTPQSVAADNEYPTQTWFCMSSNARGDAVKGIALCHHNKYAWASGTIQMTLSTGTTDGSASISKSLSALECENLARKLIDAAHHLRTAASKVPA